MIYLPPTYPIRGHTPSTSRSGLFREHAGDEILLGERDIPVRLGLSNFWDTRVRWEGLPRWQLPGRIGYEDFSYEWVREHHK